MGNILGFPNERCLHCGVLQLAAILREVKYLNFQKQKDIPGSAESLFAQNKTFQKFVDNLELITGWYNKASCNAGGNLLRFCCCPMP